MSQMMYHACVPVFQQGLKGLSTVLTKGAEHAASHGIAEADLTGARLVEDMFPLTRQVMIATDHAKGAPARLTGHEVPKWEDTETTFAELLARVQKTVDFIGTMPPEAFEGSETRAFSFKVGPNMMDFVGRPYLMQFALPNFWFHVTTAYDILRMKGVAVGKRDFLAM